MLAKVCIRISRKKDFIKPFGNRIYIRKEIPPMVNNNVDWRKVLVKIAGNISTELNLNILVEDFILQEISDRIDNSLDHIEFENPNVAKIAGIVVFCVRKLKPFYYDFDEAAKSGKLHPLNELIAIQTGLAICSQYKDDCSLLDDIRLSDRVLKDWLHSLRYHSHSPYSSILAFELLTTTDEDLKQQGVKQV